MAKPTARYVCQACGTVTPRWAGRCEACGEWNSILEEPVEVRPGAARKPGGRVSFVGLAGETAPPARLLCGIGELDRVLGGGLVSASAVLVGGDPGIGKSTLMLQAAAALSRAGKRVLYVSGEESVDQIRLRARRLGLESSPLELAAAINVRDITASLEAERDLAMVVIDSIQTMWLDNVESAPGTVTQVRACGFELIRLAKQRGFSLILVGHVTKEGTLAGPRVLEHMVDAVLHFEGRSRPPVPHPAWRKKPFRRHRRDRRFRNDRSRSGGSAESRLRCFLAERRGHIAGSAVFAGLEGTRPVLLEVQALLAPNAGGSPRRSVVGWDGGRLSMLLAVLETRCGLRLSGSDVFLNVAGGLRIGEPAADLAVAAALVSAATNTPTDAGSVYFGEVGLSGEVRQVAQADSRLKEAAKLGFERAVLPRRVARGGRAAVGDGLRLEEIGHLADLVEQFGKG